jgi:hypothetical protein
MSTGIFVADRGVTWFCRKNSTIRTVGKGVWTERQKNWVGVDMKIREHKLSCHFGVGKIQFIGLTLLFFGEMVNADAATNRSR